MRSTLVPLGLVVVLAAAAELHVDWSQNGLVVEEANEKREAVPNGVRVALSPKGLIAAEKNIKRAAGAAVFSTPSDTPETETSSRKHGQLPKPTSSGSGGDEQSQGGDDGGGGSAITVITDPRPGGAEQTITAQSQQATMFIPTLTYCGQGSAEQTSAATSEGGASSVSGNNTSSDGSSTNGSDAQSRGLQKRDDQVKAKKKKKNSHKGQKFVDNDVKTSRRHGNATATATGSGSGSGSESGCRTLYRSTVTPICHTTLRGTGVGPVTVNDCDQQVTFRQEANQNSTTEYIAKWDQVQQGHVPTGTITVRQCQAGSCTSSVEHWQEATTTAQQTRSVPVTFNEQVVGPATMNYGNNTITVPAGKTSRVAIHTQVVETQAAQQVYIERGSPSDSSNSSSPTSVGNGSTGASETSLSISSTPEEITTTITRYSSTTITVTDWPTDTGSAAGSNTAVGNDGTGDISTTDGSTDAAQETGSPIAPDTSSIGSQEMISASAVAVESQTNVSPTSTSQAADVAASTASNESTESKAAVTAPSSAAVSSATIASAASPSDMTSDATQSAKTSSISAATDLAATPTTTAKIQPARQTTDTSSIEEPAKAKAQEDSAAPPHLTAIPIPSGGSKNETRH